MARSRTTKQIAKRISLDYFKVPNPIRLTNRILIIAACVIAAGYGAYAGFSRTGQQAFNPGPVSLAHAQIQNNCTACHDGDGSGGYKLSVSDSACLSCHDGPVHHPNQALKSDRNPGAMAVLLPTSRPVHGKNEILIAANCARCHVEHKGHEALAAVADQHCTQCHANLDEHAKLAKDITIEKSVTAFGIGGGNHPEFGRSLPRDAAGRFVDPTRLAFNHAKHLALNEFKQEGMTAEQACQSCHSTWTADPMARAYGETDSESTSTIPPWTSRGNGTASITLASAGDGKYIAPISYEKHCAGCHRMELESGFEVPHERMEIVRATLASFWPQKEQSLREELAKNPSVLQPPKPTGRLRPGQRPPAPLTPEQWMNKQLEGSIRPIQTFAEGDLSKLGGGNRLQAAIANIPPDERVKHPDVLQFFAAYGMKTSCSKCHGQLSLQGAGATQPNAPPAAAGPTTRPAVASIRLETEPTGIPNDAGLRRRWFANSSFDHAAHRNESCLACHGGAPGSEPTSDLLMPAQDSCVKCHAPATATVRTAGNACVTCHGFHDHQQERRAPWKPEAPQKQGAPAVALK